MERKKTKLSGFFNVIDKIEDFILALTVIGMIIVILIQIIGPQLRRKLHKGV